MFYEFYFIRSLINAQEVYSFFLLSAYQNFIMNTMSVKQAVAERFREICAERNIKPNELANRAGVTPSSVYSMLDPSRKEITVNLVKKLCDGLDMTLGEFFSTQIFDELEQEIK